MFLLPQDCTSLPASSSLYTALHENSSEWTYFSGLLFLQNPSYTSYIHLLKSLASGQRKEENIVV